MNTVDERILIPAPPSVVWDYLSDITNNPHWQSNCRSITFLTSNQTGPGARWRIIPHRGREQVIEVLTWYERLGYEYRIVDGASFKSNQGTIRLQDTPEGTIVQWTFHYEPAGVLGGLRNAVTVKRNIDNDIVDSLWALWREINHVMKDYDEAYIAKSLMQEAPDVSTRAQYRPRYPSALKKENENSETEFAGINEPPIAPDDTKPRPAVAAEQEQMTEANVTEPDFLADVAAQSGQNERVTDEAASLPYEATVIPPVETDETIEEVDDHQPSPAAQPLSIIEPATESLIDTSEVSVFDLFGVAKPSESQQIKTIRVEDLQTQPTRSKVLTDNRSERVGLRFTLRRNRIEVRRP